MENLDQIVHYLEEKLQTDIQSKSIFLYYFHPTFLLYDVDTCYIQGFIETDSSCYLFVIHTQMNREKFNFLYRKNSFGCIRLAGLKAIVKTWKGSYQSGIDGWMCSSFYQEETGLSKHFVGINRKPFLFHFVQQNLLKDHHLSYETYDRWWKSGCHEFRIDDFEVLEKQLIYTPQYNVIYSK